jgi:hypothetical protein
LDNRLPASKVTFDRFLQSLKQELEIVSIDEGIQIDRSNEHPRKANSRMVEILHPNSNVTVESFWQDRKHDLEILFTDEGMQID